MNTCTRASHRIPRRPRPGGRLRLFSQFAERRDASSCATAARAASTARPVTITAAGVNLRNVNVAVGQTVDLHQQRLAGRTRWPRIPIRSTAAARRWKRASAPSPRARPKVTHMFANAGTCGHLRPSDDGNANLRGNDHGSGNRGCAMSRGASARRCDNPRVRRLWPLLVLLPLATCGGSPSSPSSGGGTHHPHRSRGVSATQNQRRPGRASDVRQHGRPLAQHDVGSASGAQRLPGDQQRGPVAARSEPRNGQPGHGADSVASTTTTIRRRAAASGRGASRSAEGGLDRQRTASQWGRTRRAVRLSSAVSGAERTSPV